MDLVVLVILLLVCGLIGYFVSVGLAFGLALLVLIAFLFVHYRGRTP